MLDDFDRIALAFVVNGNADRLAEHLQLLDGGGAVHVGGHQERFALFLAAHPEGNLAGEGGLTGAL